MDSMAPTGTGTRPGVPAPCLQRVRAFLVKNDSISCSWFHLLKVWSLHDTRGDSFIVLAPTLKCLAAELILGNIPSGVLTIFKLRLLDLGVPTSSGFTKKKSLGRALPLEYS